MIVLFAARFSGLSCPSIPIEMLIGGGCGPITFSHTAYTLRSSCLGSTCGCVSPWWHAPGQAGVCCEASLGTPGRSASPGDPRRSALRGWVSAQTAFLCHQGWCWWSLGSPYMGPRQRFTLCLRSVLWCPKLQNCCKNGVFTPEMHSQKGPALQEKGRPYALPLPLSPAGAGGAPASVRISSQGRSSKGRGPLP